MMFHVSQLSAKTGVLNTCHYARPLHWRASQLIICYCPTGLLCQIIAANLHRLQIRPITVRHKSNEPTEEKQLRPFINRPASFLYNTIISFKFCNSNSLAMDYLSNTNASFLPVSKHQLVWSSISIPILHLLVQSMLEGGRVRSRYTHRA